MNNNFFKILNEIDSKFIEEAADNSQKPEYVRSEKPGKLYIFKAVATVAACVALIVGGVLFVKSNPGNILPGPDEPSDKISTYKTVDADGNATDATVYGDLIDESDLSQFSLEEQAAKVREWLNDEKYEELRAIFPNDELKEAYCKARAFEIFQSSRDITDNMSIKNSTRKNKATMSIPSDNNTYEETGIDLDSFYDALYEAFTPETADRIVSASPALFECANRLWYTSHDPKQSTDLYVPGKYIVTKNTDTEFEFKTVYYHCGIVDYFETAALCNNPAMELSSRFVKTEDGWRAVDIATGNKITMLGVKPSQSGTPTGTPLAADQLTDFNYEKNLAKVKELPEQNYLAETFELFDDPEILETYYRALAFVNIFLGQGEFSYSETGASLQVITETGYEREFKQTIYTYDSFFKALCDVYTPEAVEVLDGYLSLRTRDHDNALYYWGTVGGKDFGPAHIEYEITENTADTFEFTTTYYFAPNDYDPTQTDDFFDPAKRDEYNSYQGPTRFVKTENGWRTDAVTPLPYVTFGVYGKYVYD